MIRDQVEGFELSDEVLNKYHNEAMAINYLFVGLEHLYDMVKRAEREAMHAFPGPSDSTKKTEGSFGEAVPPSVRVCAFHWYATTACNLL